MTTTKFSIWRHIICEIFPYSFFFGKIPGWKFQANPVPKNPGIPGFCKISSRKSQDWKFLIPLEPACGWKIFWGHASCFPFCISIWWFILVAAPDGVDLNSDENLGHLYLTVWFIHPPLHSIVTHDERWRKTNSWEIKKLDYIEIEIHCQQITHEKNKNTIASIMESTPAINQK